VHLDAFNFDCHSFNIAYICIYILTARIVPMYNTVEYNLNIAIEELTLTYLQTDFTFFLCLLKCEL
jgi:hypothetical protein